MANRTLDILTEKLITVGTDIMPIQSGTNELNRITVTKFFEAIPVDVGINGKLAVTGSANMIDLIFPDTTIGNIKGVRGGVDTWVIGSVDVTPDLVIRNTNNGKIRIFGGPVYIGDNLGVGEIDPQAKLHVLGNSEGTMIVESNATGSIQFKEAGVGIRGILGYSDGGSISTNAALGDMVLRTEVGKALHFAVGGSTQALIDQDGFFGIGTVTPESKLDVNNSVLSSTSIIHARVAGDANFQMVSGIGPDGSAVVDGDTFRMGLKYKVNDIWNSGIIFRRGGSTGGGYLSFMTDVWLEKMRITHDGKVGIGTIDPVVKLQVKGSTPTIQVTSTDSSATSFAQLSMNPHPDNQDYKGLIRTTRDGSSYGTYMDFYTRPNVDGNSASIKMRILADGKIGIGTTSPPYKLAVYHGDNTNSAARTTITLHSDRVDTFSAIGTYRGGSSAEIGIAFQTWNGTSLTNPMVLNPNGNLAVGVIETPYRLLVSAVTDQIARFQDSNLSYFEVDRRWLNSYRSISVETNNELHRVKQNTFGSAGAYSINSLYDRSWLQVIASAGGENWQKVTLIDGVSVDSSYDNPDNARCSISRVLGINQIIFFRNQNGITFDGNNGIVTAANFQLGSDIRYKNVLQEYKGDDIDFIRFNTEDDKRNRYGVSAQALQEVEPDLVEKVDGKLTVKYIDLLVREVARLNARVAKLEG